MTWYTTREEAEKDVERKEKLYGEEFHVIADGVQPDCWWCIRKTLIT